MAEHEPRPIEVHLRHQRVLRQRLSAWWVLLLVGYFDLYMMICVILFMDSSDEEAVDKGQLYVLEYFSKLVWLYEEKD